MSEAGFPCTAGGSVARGRKRLRLLLLGLAALMLFVAAAAFWSGRTGAGVLALLVALGPWLAWRMSSDVELRRLEVEDGVLTIWMRWRRERVPLAGVAARRLTAEETAHLERLASTGGVVAGTGGYESRLLGELDLYASDLRNAVLLELPERRLVVTPDDPEGFLAAVGRSTAT